jgi:hypothetical protein
VAAAAVCVAGLLPWQQPSAYAIEFPVENPITGNATWYDALGDPYGGCGMPQKDLETEHFIALNVYNTPKDYVFYTRPMPAGDPKIGMWDNGHNCGRWVEVTIGDYCTGVNDGVANQGFCRDGKWVSDKYNGAKLQMIVADSCGDSNAWCRDDPNHIDLHKSSINQFVKDGKPVGDLAAPENWNNRHVSWQFIPTPNYSGDIQIGFLAGSKPGWTAISISRLANGIHGLDYWFEDAWHDAEMDGDMGQAFIVKPHNTGETTYSVRVRDINDEYLHDGQVYTIKLPASCDPECKGAYQKVTYVTGTQPPGSDLVKSCTAQPKITKSWDGGYQADVTVTAGEAKIRSWTVSWDLASGQTLGDVWNGAKSVKGSTVTVANAAYNGVIEPNASVTFGYLVLGSGAASAPTMTCAPA